MEYFDVLDETTNSNQYINIRNTQIPVIIRSYKTSKTVKLFFKNNVLTITKPNNLSNKKLIEIVKKNEDYIYNKHIERTKCKKYFSKELDNRRKNILRR